MSQACADEGTVVFAKRAKQDIYNANTNNGRLGKNVQFKLCAADHKKSANNGEVQRSAFSIKSADKGQRLQKTVPSIMQTSREEKPT